MTVHWSGRPRRHCRRGRLADAEIVRNIGDLGHSMVYPLDALPDYLAGRGSP